MNNKKISFIDNQTIEYTATEILRRAKELSSYDFKSPTPIDLIVDKILNLKICFTDLSAEKILGALEPKNNIIWLDHSLDDPHTKNFTDEARCNFTIAHECGHFMFHKALYSDDRKNMAQFHNYDNPQTKMVETQANKFAAHLLMPTILVMRKWSEINSANHIETTLRELTRFFRVSRETMVIRLKTMQLIDRDYE